MINIYQLFPRLFGNKMRQTIPYGTISENGCGKFADINEEAIQSLKDMGITHIWLTGIIRHACLTDYTAYGIPPSHPAVVKGRAGSPYAISDYYDVGPDLATNPARRMAEFEELLHRIHQAGLKVLMDFVPNHLARQYRSVVKPDDVHDFGADDDNSVSFKPTNNFYYLPNEAFQPPGRALTPLDEAAKTDYTEFPSKVTGNDCFTARPTLNDWYETVKLNYGVDLFNVKTKAFDPIPDTWNKMLHILNYWAAKGVDGFRTDMSEMVPVEFWRWLIKDLKKGFIDLLFIAEIYQPSLYNAFIDAGFDFLYDKVGLYNTLENILIHNQPAETISQCWQTLPVEESRMLRFMENHDEPRLASPHLVGDAWAAMPAVAVSALMHTGPFMLYNGQEFGEEALGSPGFSGDDGRTTIFDYAHMPSIQDWIQHGRFDDNAMSYGQKQLREFYRKMLHLRLNRAAFNEGAFYDLMWANPWHSDFDPQYVYAFMRYTTAEVIVVLANFNRSQKRSVRLKIPEDALRKAGLSAYKTNRCQALDIFDPSVSYTIDMQRISKEGIHLVLQKAETTILEIKPQH